MRRRSKPTQFAGRSKPFEQDIKRTLKEYRRLGLANIIHLPPPFTIQKPMGGQFVGFLQSRQLFDYAGIVRGGRAVCFEAKSTKQPRLSFDRAGLKPHQVAALVEWGELGADSFVLWLYENRVFRFEWYKLKDHIEQTGRRSLNSEDAEKAADVKRVGLYLDPLFLLEKI